MGTFALPGKIQTSVANDLNIITHMFKMQTFFKIAAGRGGLQVVWRGVGDLGFMR